MPCRAPTQLHSDQAKVYEGQQAQAVAYQHQTLQNLQEHKQKLCKIEAVRTHLSYHLYHICFCMLLTVYFTPCFRHSRACRRRELCEERWELCKEISKR